MVHDSWCTLCTCIQIKIGVLYWTQMTVCLVDMNVNQRYLLVGIIVLYSYLIIPDNCFVSFVIRIPNPNNIGSRRTRVLTWSRPSNKIWFQGQVMCEIGTPHHAMVPKQKRLPLLGQCLSLIGNVSYRWWRSDNLSVTSYHSSWALRGVFVAQTQYFSWSPNFISPEWFRDSICDLVLHCFVLSTQAVDQPVSLRHIRAHCGTWCRCVPLSALNGLSPHAIAAWVIALHLDSWLGFHWLSWPV